MLKALFPAAAICLATLTPLEAGERVALVVGNSAYSFVAKLGSPAKDAQLMGETLESLGFALSSGSYRTNVNKHQLDELVLEFGRRANEADTAIFYFSGHGAQIFGTNYLFPIDANPTGVADYPFQLLNVEHVLEQMDASKARLKLLILDACRNNPFVRQRLKQSIGGLAYMAAPEGTVIVFATQPNNVALDGGPNAPSIYTANLVPFMRKPGLDLWTVFNDAAIATTDATKKDQQPWLQASPIRGVFNFNTITASTAPPGTVDHDSVVSDGASLKYIQKAHQQLDVRDYIGAQAALTMAIQSDPKAALPYSYRGFMWLMLGKTAKEAERFSDAGKKRAEVRVALDKYRLALDDLDVAIKLNPQYQPARRHRGNTIVAVYRARQSVGMPVNNILDDAIADLSIAGALDIKSATAANSLGEAYLLKGRYIEAITHFTRAIDIDKNHAASAYDGRCQARAKLKQWALARADANSAAALDHDFAASTCLN